MSGDTMEDRNPWDGKPFYCIICAMGLGEFMACEEPDCRLESEERAKERQRQHEQGRRDPR